MHILQRVSNWEIMDIYSLTSPKGRDIIPTRLTNQLGREIYKSGKEDNPREEER